MFTGNKDTVMWYLVTKTVQNVILNVSEKEKAPQAKKLENIEKKYGFWIHFCSLLAADRNFWDLAL